MLQQLFDFRILPWCMVMVHRCRVQQAVCMRSMPLAMCCCWCWLLLVLAGAVAGKPRPRVGKIVAYENGGKR
jgi:hypothetical protein